MVNAANKSGKLNPCTARPVMTSVCRADAVSSSRAETQTHSRSALNHNTNMSNNERDQKGGHSNSDNSDEKDWVAVKALYDDLKTTKKPRPVSDVFSRILYARFPCANNTAPPVNKSTDLLV